MPGPTSGIGGFAFRPFTSVITSVRSGGAARQGGRGGGEDRAEGRVTLRRGGRGTDPGRAPAPTRAARCGARGLFFCVRIGVRDGKATSARVVVSEPNEAGQRSGWKKREWKKK